MRFGFHVGPFSVGANDREVAAVVEFVVVCLVAFVVVGWPLSLVGHAIGLTPSWHQLLNQDQAWLHEHYPKLGLRYLGVAAAIAAVAALPVVLYETIAVRTFRSRATEDRHLREAAQREADERRARREIYAKSRREAQAGQAETGAGGSAPVIGDGPGQS